MNNELSSIKTNQNQINEQNKNENKKLNSEIDNLTNKIAKYEMTVGDQSSKLMLIEKEIDIFKSPGLSLSSNIYNKINQPIISNLEIIDNKEKINNLVENDQNNNEEYTLNNKLEDDVNFLVTVN